MTLALGGPMSTPSEAHPPGSGSPVSGSLRSGSLRSSPAVERVHDYDDRAIATGPLDWPVEVPPFRDERFRSLWHRVQYLALRATQRGVLALPNVFREGVVRSIAGAGRVFDRRHTEAARTFIQAAVPDASRAEVNVLVREGWRHLMRVALVSEGLSGRVLGERFGDHYDLSMSPEARKVVASPEGALYISAHCGFWEASCPGVMALAQRPAYGIGKAPRNDFVAQHVQRMREGQGMRLIARKGAMAAVPAAVRGGSIVGMLLDHRPRQKPVWAHFFGRPAGCDRSAGVLLRRVKAPLVFYGCYGAEGAHPLRDWRFELRFPSVIYPEELRGLGPEEIAERVNRELEALILHRPKEVFWLHDRFKNAPAQLAGGSDSETESGAEPQN